MRVLLVSEFTQHKSGYSIYGHEVMRRLHETGEFQLAELACYCREDDPRIPLVPWKVYANQPAGDSPFNPNSEHVFGAYRLDEVLNDFRPQVVFSFRDYWMDRAIMNSPYRDFFGYAAMPTVDARPQNPEWIAAYKTLDVVLTYQDWSKGELEKEYIPVLGSAPPVACDEYFPLEEGEREKIRESLGFGDKFVVFMNSRNQKRKLFPSLMREFAEFSKDKDDTILYLHSGFPEKAGWNFIELLKEYNIENKVYFTYLCSCGYSRPGLFGGEKMFCERCGKNEKFLVQPSRAVDARVLNTIYNIADVYVQYATAGGFEISQVEAAACAVPVMSVDYSAMEDIIRKIAGIPLNVLSLEKEIETGRYFAIPDGEDLRNRLEEYYGLPRSIRRLHGQKTREEYLKNYGWNKTVGMWRKAFGLAKAKKSWDSPPAYHQLPAYNERGDLDSYAYTAYLITGVLAQPEKLHTFFHTKLARDLDRGMVQGGTGDWEAFTRKTAYDILFGMRDRLNRCEQIRTSK